MPGPYNDYDFEKEAKLAQKMREIEDTNINASKLKKSKDKQMNLKEIKEVNEEDEQIDEKIWGLDEEDDRGQQNDHHLLPDCLLALMFVSSISLIF